MGRHTKGPWTVFSTPLGVGVSSPRADIAKCDGFDTMRSREEEEANAHLIAAAPAMLEALKAMVVEFKQLDLPYGSAAYLLATTAVNSTEAQP